MMRLYNHTRYEPAAADYLTVRMRGGGYYVDVLTDQNVWLPITNLHLTSAEALAEAHSMMADPVAVARIEKNRQTQGYTLLQASAGPTRQE